VICPTGYFVSSARAKNIPLSPSGKSSLQVRAPRREVANVRLAVIASAAKQSISPRKGRMDCFAALAMTTKTELSLAV